jgi:hypothetical protein
MFTDVSAERDAYVLQICNKNIVIQARRVIFEALTPVFMKSRHALLRCDTAYPSRSSVTFHTDELTPSSGQQQAAALAACLLSMLYYPEDGDIYSSKTTLNFYHTTWRHA